MKRSARSAQSDRILSTRGLQGKHLSTLYGLYRSLGIFIERPSSRSEFYLSRGARYQRGSNFIFKVAKCLAQCRLRHVQRFRRPAKVQVIGDGDEGFEVPFVHSHSFYFPINIRE